jgi:Glycosyltransferase 61
MHSLRDKVLQHYNLYSRATAGCPHHKRGHEHPLPVVGILNRLESHGRSILNADALLTALDKKYRNIIVHHFTLDQMTFIEQVTVMSHIDILISPHGAQLVSLPFMPTCGGLLEIFPVGLYLPRRYGSLAAASGLNYSFVYTGQDVEAESVWMRNENTMEVAKKFHVCVNVNKIVAAVHEHILAWHECCAQGAAELENGHGE